VRLGGHEWLHQKIRNDDLDKRAAAPLRGVVGAVVPHRQERIDVIDRRGVDSAGDDFEPHRLPASRVVVGTPARGHRLDQRQSTAAECGRGQGAGHRHGRVGVDDLHADARAARLQADLEVGAGVDNHIGDQLGEKKLHVAPHRGELQGTEAVGGERADRGDNRGVRRVTPN
jgi:hypothetical protein